MSRPPKLIDQVRITCRRRQLSYRTEQAYVAWSKRFVRFHGTRHPAGVEEEDVREFLNYLAAVYLPKALERKYPTAASSWGWQLVFAYPHRSRDTRGDVVRRHHRALLPIQRAVTRAARAARLTKRAPPTPSAIPLPRIC